MSVIEGGLRSPFFCVDGLLCVGGLRLWFESGSLLFAVDVVFLLPHPDKGGAFGQLLEGRRADIGTG